MTLCHPSVQTGDGRMVVADAEDGWFVRVDNLKQYGEDVHFERAVIHPERAARVLQHRRRARRDGAAVGAHARLERQAVPQPAHRDPPLEYSPAIVNDPEAVDVRTFGVRMPACTRAKPTYGIMGMTHFVPPSIAWLWRLIAPRGDKNPSIGEAADAVEKLEHGGMVAEGVGSYWPFSTGTKVAAANLLLRQIMEYPRTRYVLTPNQHIGAYKVGFSAEWLTREWLAAQGRGPHARRPA